MPKMLNTARAAAMSALLIGPLMVALVYAAPTAPAPQPKISQTDVLSVASDMAETTSQTSKSVWTALNTELSYSNATYEIRNKALRVIKPIDKAMGGGLTWADNTMSRPALFLMLAFLSVLTLLSLSSATDRTGNYH